MFEFSPSKIRNDSMIKNRIFYDVENYFWVPATLSKNSQAIVAMTSTCTLLICFIPPFEKFVQKIQNVDIPLIRSSSNCFEMEAIEDETSLACYSISKDVLNNNLLTGEILSYDFF